MSYNKNKDSFSGSSYDPGKYVTMMYAIREPNYDFEQYPDVSQEDINNALKTSATKLFKWHVVLDNSLKTFDTKEEAEEYVNSLQLPTKEDLYIFWGQLQKATLKMVAVVEPAE